MQPARGLEAEQHIQVRSVSLVFADECLLSVGPSSSDTAALSLSLLGLVSREEWSSHGKQVFKYSAILVLCPEYHVHKFLNAYVPSILRERRKKANLRLYRMRILIIQIRL
jgi:hypothetical protein